MSGPYKFPGETTGWNPTTVPPSFVVGSNNDIDSLKARQRLPVLDFGTSRHESLSPAKSLEDT
eukprot:3347110-Prorocentrum_lima.AAC.1